MSFFTHLGTFLVAPFLMVSAFFGMGTHATNTTPAHTLAATTTTSVHATSSLPVSTTTSIYHPITKTLPPTVATTSTTTALHIDSLSTTSGVTGSTVVIHGTGFTNESRVIFGPGVIKGDTVSSSGTSISFTVPSSIGPDCRNGFACPMYLALITNGTFAVSVHNGDVVSNSRTYTVTGSVDAPMLPAQQ